MAKPQRWLLWVMSVLVGLMVPSPAMTTNTYLVAEQPRPHDSFASADYRLWVPTGRTALRGAIVLQHGCGEAAGRHSLDHVDDPQWQTFGTEAHLALLAVHLTPGSSLCASWSRPESGSGDALVRALKTLATISRHKELVGAPLYLWGHSGGGSWAVSFAAVHRELVRAIVVKSGACPPPVGEVTDAGPCIWLENEAIRKIPILFILGAHEGQNDGLGFFLDRLQRLYLEGAQAAAPWWLAKDPTAGHEVAHSRELAIRFFAVCLGMSIPGGSQSQPRAKKCPEPGRYSLFAAAIREFDARGTISGARPPSPTSVRVSPFAAGVLVSWKAGVDMFNGAAEFRVYHKGLFAGALRGWEITDGGRRDPFSSWNYNDQPVLPIRDMRLAVSSTNDTNPAHWTVTQVNGSGTESGR